MEKAQALGLKFCEENFPTPLPSSALTRMSATIRNIHVHIALQRPNTRSGA